jgi:hypothetical protein
MPIKLATVMLRDQYNTLGAEHKKMFVTHAVADTRRLGQAIGQAFQLSETFRENGFVRFGLIGSQKIGK